MQSEFDVNFADQNTISLGVAVEKGIFFYFLERGLKSVLENAAKKRHKKSREICSEKLSEKRIKKHSEKHSKKRPDKHSRKIASVN